MKLETLARDAQAGWSLQPFPEMDSDRTLVLVFGSSDLLDDPASVQEVVRAYPSSHVVGCSSAGEIHGTRVLDGGLSVAVARFEHSSLATAFVPVDGPAGSYEAGRELARALMRPDLRGVLILSDGLSVNGSELVRGVNAVLPESVVVTGGLAGDGDRFARTWVLAGGALASGRVCAVGFYGERLHVGHGSKGGWDKFGPERRVTRSHGNVLFELDGKPALQLYKEYLGERAAGLPATGLLFPLSVRAGRDAEKTLVRTILAVDEARQSMTFAGDVPEGYLAQLMRANFDRLIGGASEAALMTRQTARELTGDTLAVAISCVGRRLVLGERTEEELESTLDALPSGARQVGFYSYGEISPFTSGSCDLHNQTMTLTAICEV